MTNLMSNMFGNEGAPGVAEPEAAAAGVPPVSGGFEQILNSAQQFAMNMNSQNPDFVAQMRERMNIQNPNGDESAPAKEETKKE